ncbi:MAG: hypothetical protein PHT16_02120 [Candidatus Pacebacteria bacterium]|nr:hypothetical protein [Candidatus Paceibacterota bacterium]
MPNSGTLLKCSRPGCCNVWWHGDAGWAWVPYSEVIEKEATALRMKIKFTTCNPCIDQEDEGQAGVA